MSIRVSSCSLSCYFPFNFKKSHTRRGTKKRLKTRNNDESKKKEQRKERRRQKRVWKERPLCEVIKRSYTIHRSKGIIHGRGEKSVYKKAGKERSKRPKSLTWLFLFFFTTTLWRSFCVTMYFFLLYFFFYDHRKKIKIREERRWNKMGETRQATIYIYIALPDNCFISTSDLFFVFPFFFAPQ